MGMVLSVTLILATAALSVLLENGCSQMVVMLNKMVYLNQLNLERELNSNEEQLVAIYHLVCISVT